MLELRTLGTLGLKDGAATEYHAVLKQPKRLALLLYLALEAGDRWVRRDVLLSLFWPELDQSHARAALRRALFFLRQSLGDQTIEGRGDEELRLQPGAVRCDATEFESLATGNPRAALQLYRGALLEGLYIAGAPEADDWLDRTRARLHRLAAKAAWALAEDPLIPSSEAVAWARRAAGFSLLDEESTARLMRFLERMNDRGGALAAYQEFARRLRLDLDAAPSTDLQTLADQIRQTPPEPPTGSAGTITILIPAFAVSGDPSLAYLSEGLANLFGSALDGIGDFKVARSSGADATLRGSLVVLKSRFRLSGSLEAANGQVLSRGEAEGAGEESVFQLVDQVARQLAATRGDKADQRLTRLGSRTTASLPALRLWLEGERWFRQGNFLAALDAYQQSTSADQSFALGHYRSASAAAACAMVGPARGASRLAMSVISGQSERERLLIEAQDGWLHGQTDEAERRYALLTANYPDDFDAWYLLGDLLFHGNPYRGRSIREARGALERALQLNQGHLSTLVKLARLAALERDWPRLDQLVTRLTSLSPESPQTLGVRGLRAAALARPEEFAEILARLREAPALAIAVAFSDLALYGPGLSQANKVGSQLAGMFRSAELQAFGQLVLAVIAVARGDLNDAERLLESSRELDAGWALEIGGLLAALPFVQWSPQQIERSREELLSWDPARQRPNVGLPLAFHNTLHAHIRAYLLGLLAARMRDIDGIIEAEEILAELEVPEEAVVLVQRLERSLRAEVLTARGDYPRALQELEQAPTDIWFQYAVASPFFGGAFERWRRSTLLRKAGRVREADGWLNSIAERSPWELPFRLAQGTQA